MAEIHLNFVIPLEAFQWDGSAEGAEVLLKLLRDWTQPAAFGACHGETLQLRTLHWGCTMRAGDWLVRMGDAECYVWRDTLTQKLGLRPAADEARKALLEADCLINDLLLALASRGVELEEVVVNDRNLGRAVAEWIESSRKPIADLLEEAPSPTHTLLQRETT